MSLKYEPASVPQHISHLDGSVARLGVVVGAGDAGQLSWEDCFDYKTSMIQPLRGLLFY